jgi:lycopene cyclase domain-containing protein
MSLYLWLIVGSFTGPFLLSFDRRVHFYTYWKRLFPAISIVAVLFIIWDQLFTQEKIWGFTPEYLQGIYLGDLPLEEVLFFFVVPYACVFIYEVLKAYFPNLKLMKLGQVVAFAITFAGFLFGTLHMDNWYTASACLIASLLTVGIYFVERVSWYGNFALMYLVAMIPFLIVNGVLTGAVTPDPVVWYSADHIMGPRIITIPVEDMFYNYSMLLPIVWLFERFKK